MAAAAANGQVKRGSACAIFSYVFVWRDVSVPLQLHSDIYVTVVDWRYNYCSRHCKCLSPVTIVQLRNRNTADTDC